MAHIILHALQIFAIALGCLGAVWVVLLAIALVSGVVHLEMKSRGYHG